jgi:hypothetical protein
MKINAIKNVAAQNCCFDMNKNPIQVGDMICFANGTAYGGGTPVYTGIVDKIKANDNRVHVKSNAVGVKVYLRAQYCLNISSLFNVDVNSSAENIMQEQEKVKQSKITTRMIFGIYHSATEYGLMEIAVNSTPGQAISNTDINKSISSFIEKTNIEDILILDKNFKFVDVSKCHKPHFYPRGRGHFFMYKEKDYVLFQASKEAIHDTLWTPRRISPYLSSYQLKDFLFTSTTESRTFYFGENSSSNPFCKEEVFKSILDQYTTIFKSFQKN